MERQRQRDALSRSMAEGDRDDHRMGVGVPNGLRARTITDERTFMFNTLSPSELGTQFSFAVEAKERVRVVLAWDQCPEYDRHDQELWVDLDMVVEAPSRVPRQVTHHVNPSFLDNWEVVEFITEASGEAKVSLSAARFRRCTIDGDQAQVRAAFAWTKEPAPDVLE